MRMHNAAYFYSITSNSISCLNSWEDIQFGVGCGVAVKVWSRQQFFQVIYDTPFHITCLPFVSFLHWFCPFCIVFEVFHYKADTCANNSALSLIVMCLRPHSPPHLKIVCILNCELAAHPPLDFSHFFETFRFRTASLTMRKLDVILPILYSVWSISLQSRHLCQ